MSGQMVQFPVEPADAPEVEVALRRTCAPVDQQGPAGTRVAACELDDGCAFLNLLHLEQGVPDPLPGIDRCRTLPQRRAGWALADQPPAPQPVPVSGRTSCSARRAVESSRRSTQQRITQ